MAYTFLKSQEIGTGDSLVENLLLKEAKSFLDHCAHKKIRVILPHDHLIVSSIDEMDTQYHPYKDIPHSKIGVDIGSKTMRMINDTLLGAKMVLWNGPMGIYENPKTREGTSSVARAVSRVDGFTIIGGGDSAAAVSALGLEDRFSHVSTGGGATLELLEGKKLPGIEALKRGKHEK